jgi:NADH-quinone oxidoreductase subunit G
VCRQGRCRTDRSIASVTVTPEAQAIADSLVSGSNSAVLLGNFAQQHPQAATLHALGRLIAATWVAGQGFLGEAANSVGGYVAKAVPGNGGFNAAAMLKTPLQAYVVVGAEPELDTADGAQALPRWRKLPLPWC